MWFFFSLMLPLCVSAPEEASIAIPYDARTSAWLFDPEGIVSRNDVVYDSLSPEPWDAMPTGGGDVSAMVRFDGESIHLHLTKCDAWGYQAPATDPPGTRYFNNVSPGHVRIVLGERAKTLAAERFRQRLDLYHGRVTLELGNAPCTRIDVWGHPARKVLVVEVADAEQKLGPIAVELSEWRDTMQVGVENGIAFAKEIQTRPARPHMASAGMQDYFADETDPMLGRGTSVTVGVAGKEGVSAAEGQVATLSVDSGWAECRVLIAAAVTPRGDPLAASRQELDDALAMPPAQLREEHQAWWRDYWSKSFVRLESPDNAAQWVTAAYHIHLYTLGCVNRGPVPAKWDGGAGLMRGDERTWGLAEWVQEIRFTFLPLYAANRLDMAKGLTNHYTQMLPYLREQTQKMWGIPGLWIPETVLPWGGIEDWVLDEDLAGCVESYGQWDPATAPYGRFERYNRYVGFLFTCGPEMCWHYLTYYKYSGDEAFLKDEAYPVIRGVAEFMSGLLREGEDGAFHLNPANALETWWMVKDPSDTMDAIRWLFPEFIRLSERFGQDAELRARCVEQLTKLPNPPLGVWHPDGTIDAAIEAYAPAAALGTPPKNNNFENPALYRVFPFGLSGIGTDDRDRAVRTFEHRIYPLGEAWALDPVWAARLGLRDEACALLTEHTRKWNRFRYGGWDSGNSGAFPGELAVAPYTDAAGVACYALNEILLQSHNGVIRILPAIAGDWSGTFRLRAEGGFLVGVDFRDGKAQFVEITSLFGGECRLESPWTLPCAVRCGNDAVISNVVGHIVFATEEGKTYWILPEEWPLSVYVPVPCVDMRNEDAGMPGRDIEAAERGAFAARQTSTAEGEVNPWLQFVEGPNEDTYEACGKEIFEAAELEMRLYFDKESPRNRISRQLYAPEDDADVYERFEKLIVSGNAYAMELAFQLIAAQDGHLDEALCQALGQATQVAPSLLLRTVRRNAERGSDYESVGGEVVCFPVDEVVDNPGAKARIARERIAALKRVNDPELASLRDKCVGWLAEIVARCEREATELEAGEEERE